MDRLPFFVATPLRLQADAVSAYASLLNRYAEVLRALSGQEGHDRGGFHVPVVPAAGGSGGGGRKEAGDTGRGAPAADAGRGARRTETADAGGRTPGDAGRPDRAEDEEHTLGRQAAERKEPTPEPAQGASAALTGQRRVSNPKAARKVRKRATSADATDTVATEGGTGRGGTPSKPAENTPKERASTRRGREPAPLGSKDTPDAG